MLKRRSYLLKGCILLLVSVFFLYGCGDGSAAAKESVAGKTYVYTGDTFTKMENDFFIIAFNEDGTFSYTESLASSYMGVGTWEIRDDLLIMTDNGHSGSFIQNFFRIDGEELVFVEDGSSNFIYMKVQDGERFVVSGDTTNG